MRQRRRTRGVERRRRERCSVRLVGELPLARARGGLPGLGRGHARVGWRGALRAFKIAAAGGGAASRGVGVAGGWRGAHGVDDHVPSAVEHPRRQLVERPPHSLGAALARAPQLRAGTRVGIGDVREEPGLHRSRERAGRVAVAQLGGHRAHTAVPARALAGCLQDLNCRSGAFARARQLHSCPRRSLGRRGQCLHLVGERLTHGGGVGGVGRRRVGGPS
mmetsp:Transcript_11972/g.35523  ORF Transcript_11972/g.35523 Transcript_11972/m.35523 type:complete len:220 (-) Transcript_11972:204-863(-)